MSAPENVIDAEVEREAERRWIAWAKLNFPVEHIGAGLAQLDRIATALEKLAASRPLGESPHE